MMNGKDLELSSLCIIKEYNEGNIEQATQMAQHLQQEISKFCQENNGYEFSEKFYKSLISLIKIEENQVSQQQYGSITINLAFIRSILGVIRNSFYKNSLNQQMVGENENLHRPIDSFLKTLIGSVYILIKERIKEQQLLPIEDRAVCPNTLETAYYDTLSVCITSFINMMAGNSSMRRLNWPFLQPIVINLLSFPTPKVSHVGAALLHQFLLEDDLKEQIVCADFGEMVFSPLLKSYMMKGHHSCFSLFCIEILLKSMKIVPQLWESLTEEESLLVLDISTTLIQRKDSISEETVSYIEDKFKKEADKIFRVYDGRDKSLEPNVITRMTNFLCCVASSDHFRETLQKDKSLLISSVYLLKGVTDIGDNSENAFTRISDTDGSKDAVDHPAFGFKSDLIRLIAALVFRHQENQNTVREIDGLLLLLENSQYDARNPLIREATILALRNLLEGNYENQKIISELKLEGVAENRVLDELGMSATVEKGKISLLQN